MRQTTRTGRKSSGKIVKDIKRATRKQYSSEEKIRIVLDGLRGEDSIAECTSSDHMAPMGPLSKRHFSARCFSSLAC